MTNSRDLANLGGGFIQAGGGVQRSVESKLSDVVSVKDFGAVGDGVADDTAAIQAAIDTGKTVYFPLPSSGYLVSSSLTVSTFNQVLVGETGSVENRPTIFLSPSAADNTLLLLQNGSVKLKDLALKGKGIDAGGSYVIYAELASGAADIDLYLYDTIISNSDVGVQIVGRGLTCGRSSFVKCAKPFVLDWPASFVPGANPDQTAASGMRVYRIFDCRFHAMNGERIITNTGSNSSNIQGVSFVGNYIDTTCAIYTGKLSRSIITGNTLVNGNQSAFPVINLTGGAGVTISNNIFAGMDDNGSGVTHELFQGILAVDTSCLQVTGNYFSRFTRDVVSIGSGCSNICVTNNTMKNVCLDNATSSAKRAPVRISAALSGLSVCNNIIDTPNMTYNDSIVFSSGGPLIQQHQISGNIFDSTSWKASNFSAGSVDSRLNTANSLVRYNGDGSASQAISFSFKPHGAIICDMTASTNKMVMVTSGSTAGSTFASISGYDVSVTGDYNLSSKNYCVYAFA